MTIIGYKDILDRAISFINDDSTELWIISTHVQELNPTYSIAQVLDATKIIASDLITNHHVTLVDYPDKSTSEAIELINKHLTRFNKVPDIGDGLWMWVENTRPNEPVSEAGT